eukprot:TRINITY_DN67653_c7_g1_i2.p1 TRINITY_DN67653_c7_g1~~TRINITY_DN67653_c7_g1_i2.p1  ORF type:complete len:200 (-),score=20.42 TRINITY_DN67653_c7_g1_i2:618-1217(-)
MMETSEAPPKKVLFLVGDYVEDYEIMVPFQSLKALGYEPYAICPGKKAEDIIRTAVHDFEGDQTYSERKGHNFQLNLSFKDVVLEEYVALVIPGGRSAEYIRLHEKILDIVKYFMKENKPVAAICHGPLVLAAAGVLSGRRLTAYPACGPDIRSAGGEFVEVDVSEAVTEGNLITAPAWPAQPAWISQLLTALGCKIQI